MSERQLQRLQRAYSDGGVAGLAHGNRGRSAHNAVDPAIAARVVELAGAKYQGFNHQHLTEMLGEHDCHRSAKTGRWRSGQNQPPEWAVSLSTIGRAERRVTAWRVSGAAA
ncbi:MAG: hypothetical protein ACYDAL_12810 [Candidatus Dormibacteraceae bacterium]